MPSMKDVEHIYKSLVRTTRRRYFGANLNSGRPWRNSLPDSAIQSIQRGTLNYFYRGIRMAKNPFDIAIYQLLIWHLKPRLIIEIGSGCGASAIWFADLLKTYEIDGRVISIDVTPPDNPMPRDDVTYVKGDGRNLDASLFAANETPILLVEDADHLPETTSAVLDFFDRISSPGDYIVVEDANIIDLGMAHRFKGGPAVAISRFLSERGENYAIDASMCDLYGRNFTGNTNGYIRRVL